MNIFNNLIKLKGKEGENIAEKFLKSSGYKIIQKNYKTRMGEIDLIYQTAHLIGFCEVKNYKENAQVHPLLYIKTKQKDKILKTIQYYIHKENLYDRMIQFDILLIQDNKVKEHIKNVRLK